MDPSGPGLDAQGRDHAGVRLRPRHNYQYLPIGCPTNNDRRNQDSPVENSSATVSSDVRSRAGTGFPFWCESVRQTEPRRCARSRWCSRACRDVDGQAPRALVTRPMRSARNTGHTLSTTYCAPRGDDRYADWWRWPLPGEAARTAGGSAVSGNRRCRPPMSRYASYRLRRSSASRLRSQTAPRIDAR